jgi:ornithine lipid ester-linked acyl 2-hydroxylase
LVKRWGKRLLRGKLLDLFGRQSLVPDEPVLGEEHFPWAVRLRSESSVIREELDRLLVKRALLPSFQDISPDQFRISEDTRWKVFMLYGFGKRLELGSELCPRTAATLASVPGLTTAFFSILSPGKHIPRHRGITKSLIRAHLGLHVPKGSGRCLMQIGDTDYVWREGELLFFDDTCSHEVWNETQEERAVLLFDFERPMRPLGRLASRLSLSVLRHTNYFKNAQRNQRVWEARYRELLARAETGR